MSLRAPRLKPGASSCELGHIQRSFLLPMATILPLLHILAIDWQGAFP
ncbi:unnamed protein product [Chondrus crispus]|uniref:Uncharacterized protein n=1 Tax=Chondrus crispus TaxID=2769 RepID=R7QGQ9_CHOCR|nr:unnamed protein product [Chondrus crispus]CDF36595.1 unnamed protein product [Chondrus crispus]|eukprot:XP_005716414.1 unnamed protein product [Chondrus crispus]